MSRPLVSVIVPVFNAEPHLPRCIDSLRSQTYEELEIILVDDGSTDGSASICAGFAHEDARVKVVTRPNGGLSAARNTGLQAAGGDYVQFIDADDWAEPGMLAWSVDLLTRTSGDVLISGHFIDVVDRSGALVQRLRHGVPRLTIDERHSLPAERATLPVVESAGYAWNKLYRGELLRRHGFLFEVGTSLIEDILFNAQVFQEARAVVLTDRMFAHYVRHSRGTLGSRYYADYAALGSRALRAQSEVLRAWGLGDSETQRALAAPRAVRILEGASLVAGQTDVRWRDRVGEVRRLVVALDLGGLMRLSSTRSAVPGRQWAVLSLLARDRVLTALFLLRLNDARNAAVFSWRSRRRR